MSDPSAKNVTLFYATAHGQGENLHDELDLRNVDNFDKPIIALLGKCSLGSALVVLRPK